MSQKKQRDKTSLPQGHRRSRRAGRISGWWLMGMAALAVVVAGGWFLLRDRAAPQSAVALPGPEGGRDIAQDVNTLVGTRAPSFTLSTADGRSHAVTPGRGRPTVFIFHMGIG